jgi:outer membrane lipopolysaccharide assembly protein LptE/RlpB
MTLPLNHTGLVAITCLCLILLMGCGYQMVGKETHVPPDLTSIAIPTFQNKTYEPGIEIQFTQAFLREFILDKRVKVVTRAEADSILEGIIKSFTVYSVAFDKAGYVSQYEATVVMDLTLKDRAGKVLWESRDLSETAWYRASSKAAVGLSGLTYEANKQAALQEIGRLAAGRVRNRFFYNF